MSDFLENRKRRQLSRLQSEALQKAGDAVRRFEAAGNGRRAAGWHALSTGPNAEIRGGIVNLRNRARDLGRNNPYARRAVTVIAANTVGTGIRPVALNPSASPAARKRGGAGGLAAALDALWLIWAGKTLCDFDGRKNFYMIEKLVMKSVAESGEAVVLRRRLTAKQAKKYGGIPMQLQVIEADYLDSMKDQAQTEGGGYISQGVEFDSDGRRIGYWIFDRHPGDGYGYGINSTFRPVEDILHIYDELRPGQVRGIPFGTAAMLTLRDLDDYTDAEIMRKKVGACFAVAITDGGDASPAAGLLAGKSESLIPDHIEPGMVQSLGPGQNIELITPPPSEGYEEFLRRTLQAVAAGWSITYEQLTSDYSNVNFSSARMARIEFNRIVKEWQTQMLIPLLCEPVWNWFVEAAVVADMIPASAAGMECKWILPAVEMVDPTKEGKALITSVQAGLTSWADAARQQGREPAELLAEIAADNAAADALGVRLITDARYFAGNGSPIPPPAAEGEEGAPKPKPKPATKKPAEG